MELSRKKFDELACKTGAHKCHLFSYTGDTQDCCSMHDNLEIYLPCEVLNGQRCEFYETEKRKIQALEKIEKLKDLYQEAVSKSEELMPGDFKQYFDEDFTDKMAEILYGGEYEN